MQQKKVMRYAPFTAPHIKLQTIFGRSNFCIGHYYLLTLSDSHNRLILLFVFPHSAWHGASNVEIICVFYRMFGLLYAMLMKIVRMVDNNYY